MKQQTALQEVYKKFDEFPMTEQGDDAFLHWLGINRNKLLEKEKQQIIEFGNKMQIVSDVDHDGNVKFCFNPETHYQQTFTGKPG